MEPVDEQYADKRHDLLADHWSVLKLDTRSKGVLEKMSDTRFASALTVEDIDRMSDAALRITPRAGEKTVAKIRRAVETHLATGNMTLSPAPKAASNDDKSTQRALQNELVQLLTAAIKRETNYQQGLVKQLGHLSDVQQVYVKKIEHQLSVLHALLARFEVKAQSIDALFEQSQPMTAELKDTILSQARRAERTKLYVVLPLGIIVGCLITAALVFAGVC
ncbi:hypothetical protein [uncultured Erythrobacter sp.]|uniref:hypothetical protein n=1 Tax=uncultured Erythrobacter sp. TaxID=263913 RepID=UPI0026029C1A|nr:hypothetical protein [uncultured Erythrobacter sp.]